MGLVAGRNDPPVEDGGRRKKKKKKQVGWVALAKLECEEFNSSRYESRKLRYLLQTRSKYGVGLAEKCHD